MPQHEMMAFNAGHNLVTALNNFKEDDKFIVSNNGNSVIFKGYKGKSYIFATTLAEVKNKCNTNKYVSFNSVKKSGVKYNYSILAVLVNKEDPFELGSWNFYSFLQFMNGKTHIPYKNMREYSMKVEEFLLRVE